MDGDWGWGRQKAEGRTLGRGPAVGLETKDLGVAIFEANGAQQDRGGFGFSFAYGGRIWVRPCNFRWRAWVAEDQEPVTGTPLYFHGTAGACGSGEKWG